MNKSETVQLFSKIIMQNKEIKELLLRIQAHQGTLSEKQKMLREGQSKLVKNQNTIWEAIKRMA